MHISEGVLKPEILVAGWVISASLCSFAFYKMSHEEVPKSAVLSALFFLASFIHIPVGVTSIHLMLTGLIGVLAGFRVFAIVIVGLLLQGIIFGYGGLSTLGINTFNIATPAFLGYLIFKYMYKNYLTYFLVGFAPVLLSAFLLSLALVLNGDEFILASKLAFISNLPLMIVEGIIAMFAIGFIQKVSPKLLKENI